MTLTKSSILHCAIPDLETYSKRKLLKLNDLKFMELLCNHGILASSIGNMYIVHKESKNYDKLKS